MTTATRIYLVTIGDSDRLVRATHPAQALMHVARDIASVAVASQDDLVNCIADGISVESAHLERVLESIAADVAPTDSKTLEMWPMPTAASYSPPETDEGDEGDEELIPVATHSPRVRLPAKYFDPHTGSTWSGRGVMPVWLKAALHGGKKLEDFLAAVATA